LPKTLFRNFYMPKNIAIILPKISFAEIFICRICRITLWLLSLTT
jgi:hypothetical protein